MANDNGPTEGEKAALRRAKERYEENVALIRRAIPGVDGLLAEMMAGAVAFEGMPRRLLCWAVASARRHPRPAEVLVYRFLRVGLPYSLTACDDRKFMSHTCLIVSAGTSVLRVVFRPVPGHPIWIGARSRN